VGGEVATGGPGAQDVGQDPSGVLVGMLFGGVPLADPTVPLWKDPEDVPRNLIERVWEPGPRWQLLNELARQKRTRLLSQAMNDATDQFQYTGFYRPSWWGKQPGRGYAWYSNRSYTSGLKAFREIIEDQYGPLVDGAVYAPRRRPLVPF
jgi:hypothetical protein